MPSADAKDLLDFIDNVPMPLHWVGPDGTILWANRAELELLGYSQTEYVGRDVREFHVDADVAEEILGRLGHGETLTEHASRLRCRDGSIKDVLITSNARWQGGEFTHSRCVTVDVTERRRAEEIRALLAAVVAASDDAIVSKDLDGVIRTWNEAAERLFGYAAAEAIGKPVNIIIPPELQGQEQRILEHLRRGEPIDHFETVRLTKDGRRVEVSLTISPVRDADGRIIGASKIARDISERKHAEHALRASEERFRAIVETQAELICRFRVDGTLLFVNTAYARAFGTTPEALSGGNLWKIVSKEDRARVRETLESLTPEAPDVRIENRVQTARGERWVLWTNRALSFDGDGRVLEAQSAGIDITDRKRAEEALVRADRRKNEFLATLGHELRNPLAPLRNAVEILRLPHADPGQHGRALDMMARQIDVIVRLVDDLLDVSRITEGKLTLRKERVDVAALIQSALNDTRDLVDEAGHELSVLQPDEPVFVDADAMRLSQVLSNLLSNAAKYTPDGGHIELRVEQAAGEIRISVRDDGLGIPKDKLEAIFEMFSQVDRSAESGHKGLGIGLSLVRWLTELHGGRIEVRSRGPGLGSEFTVRLPAASAVAATGQRAPASEHGRARETGYRVLIVEDNADAARSLGMLARMLGHEVRLAFDGFGAVEAAAEFRPEVVLLDVGLPGQSGYDVARQIRRHDWGASVVLAAVTGWGQEADRELAFEAGCDFHVTKPLTLQRLDEVLASVSADKAPVS